jgi:hypothetical protein
MECIKCGGTDTAVSSVDHIYPVRVLGMPAFWKWVSPGLARGILTFNLTVSIGTLAVSMIWFAGGETLPGAAALILFLFASSIFIRCAGALKHHMAKPIYRCGSCGLEWSPSGEPNV